MKWKALLGLALLFSAVAFMLNWIIAGEWNLFLGAIAGPVSITAFMFVCAFLSDYLREQEGWKKTLGKIIFFIPILIFVGCLGFVFYVLYQFAPEGILNALIIIGIVAIGVGFIFWEYHNEPYEDDLNHF